MFDCGQTFLIPREALCNGTDECAGSTRAGDDETAVICDSKQTMHGCMGDIRPLSKDHRKCSIAGVLRIQTQAAITAN